MAKIELNGLTGQILLNEVPVIDLVEFNQTKSSLYKGDLPYGANLNDLNESGTFHQLQDASAASGSNYPVAKQGILVVHANTNGTFQLYQTDELYFRSKISGLWSSWNKVAHEGNISDLIEDVDFKTINGQPITGTGDIQTVSFEQVMAASLYFRF